jgi:hemoglobin-like flavoprotein
MTPEQKELVQRTFEKVKPIGDTAAALFYGRLFDLDPTLERLFEGDLEDQGRKLMQMIGLAIKGLNRPAELLPLLHEFGKRHAAYGVAEHDYDTVGAALLWTLKQGLGDAFTAKVGEAWTAVYELLSNSMKAGAKEALVVTTASPGSKATTCTSGDRKSWREYFPTAGNKTSKKKETEMQTEENYETLTGRFASTFGSIVMMIGFIFLFSVAACAATFHVTNTNDSGAGSLREAINQSNMLDPATPNLIDFQILPAGGVKTISLLSELPWITSSVVIDGTTQPGYAGAPLIELDGSNTGNNTTGLNIIAGNSTVKGLIINRFSTYGISLRISGQNVIAGNYFGLDSTGTISLPIGGVSLYIETSGNLIGGTTPAERNVISGVNNRGIYFGGNEATGNLVKGNYIGTDASGTVIIGNTTGITLDNAPGNTIGGAKLSERNVISGNGNGIDMTGSGTSDNAVRGNYIGTKADGTSNLQNDTYGIYIFNGAHSNVIGGTSLGQANVIAFQVGQVVLESDAGSGNIIRGNSFFSSAQMAIDLGNDGVTANDAGDADLGANDLQNYPVITSAVANSGTVSITGTLNSISNKQFIIDLYSSPALSQQGNAEARKYLTSISTSTDGSGDANFNASVPLAKLTGQLISATATNDGNSTSELSLPAQVTGLNGVLQFSGPTYSVNENGAQATITVTRTDGSVDPVAVNYATGDGTAKQPGDYTFTSGTLFWPDGDTSSQSFNIPIIDDNVSDQNETINLTLTSPVGGATLGAQSAAVLTIVDNEQPPNPADLVVTNTNDSGAGSLRQAILTANALVGTDTISFNIQPAGVYTITPLSALPNVTDPVMIDATTQPGFAGAPVIELNGASAGQNFVTGLTIVGGSSTVKGFVINRFTGLGVLLLSADNTVAGNFIGIDVTGNNKLVGNVSLGNNEGIGISGDNANNNVIGGMTAAARNVVSNNQIGIDICCDGHPSGNKIVGNYVGTNASGDAALRNGNNGIRIDTAPNTIVGGTTPAERNVISGNSGGIILGNDSAGTLIQGNYIGTKADGTSALGNNYAGINISSGATGATVGGAAVGASNVIAFNGKGNAGEGGVTIYSGSPFSPGKSITVSQNAIFSNNGLGIDLNNDGVTANDAADGDNGANDLQNSPVLTSVVTNGGNTVVQGTLNSEASKSYHVELFSNSTCSTSGFGEGQFFVAGQDVATDANGNAGFTFTVPTASITGAIFTATATNPNKSTSEFSACASGAAVNPGTIQFGANFASVSENAGSLAVTVTRISGTTGTVTVAYATANGVGSTGATFPADYTQTAGTLTFLDGETSKLITVPIIDDSVSESQKFFSLSLSNPTGGATLGIQTSIQIAIGDDDKPTMSISDVQVTEGNSGTTDAVFTVSLQRPHYADAHVDFATLGGTAASGTDYQPASGTLTFLKGETTKTITVTVNGDTVKEPNETFNVKLSNNDELGIIKGQGTGTIIDDDAQPSISINDVSQVEGNSGQTTFVFNATLSAASSQIITIAFATAAGTANGNDDYQTVSGTLTFNPGETSKSIAVAVNGDVVSEPDETFFVQLSNPVNASIAKAKGTGTITNDDASISGSLNFTLASYSVNEDGGNATVTVKRTGGSNGAVSVQYATSGGSATANSDYTSTSGMLSWADGDSADKTFTIAIANDGMDELDETVNVALSSPSGGASLGNQSSAVLTIIDDDAQPAISISDVSQAEGKSGSTNFSFEVTLSAASSRTVNVDYLTTDGTALAGGDYQAASGTLTFAPGETTKSFSVMVNGDAQDEPTETFVVNLSNPSNATIAKGQSTGTIVNDDSATAPTIEFSQAAYGAAEQLGTINVTVTRSGDVSSGASVDYATADGSAAQKSDFEYTAGTLNFNPGEVSKIFVVLLNQDSYSEGPESFNLVLSNPAGAALGAQAVSQVSITDDLPETSANPIDNAQTFVHMQYHDFLNREPDPAGLAFWTNQITSCGNDAQCLESKRINVSAAFFLSIEFQETGYLRYLLQKESFGSTPKYAEFMRDVQEVSRGVIVNAPGWEQKVKDNQQQFAEKWVQRPDFKALYDGLSNDDYVTALYKNAGIVAPQAEKDKLVTALDAASMNRATVLLDVAADATFRQQEKNAAFVMMEYFGYLRRDANAAPDSDLSGYNFWLNKLNQFGGNYIDAEMIKAFITSTEYRQRFAQ